MHIYTHTHIFIYINVFCEAAGMRHGRRDMQPPPILQACPLSSSFVLLASKSRLRLLLPASFDPGGVTITVVLCKYSGHHRSDAKVTCRPAQRWHRAMPFPSYGGGAFVPSNRGPWSRARARHSFILSFFLPFLPPSFASQPNSSRPPIRM